MYIYSIGARHAGRKMGQWNGHRTTAGHPESVPMIGHFVFPPAGGADYLE